MKTIAKVPDRKVAAQRPKPADALARANKIIDEMEATIEKIVSCEYEVSILVSPLLLLDQATVNGHGDDMLGLIDENGEKQNQSCVYMALGATLRALAWKLRDCTDILDGLHNQLRGRLREYRKFQDNPRSVPQEEVA